MHTLLRSSNVVSFHERFNILILTFQKSIMQDNFSIFRKKKMQLLYQLKNEVIRKDPKCGSRSGLIKKFQVKRRCSATLSSRHCHSFRLVGNQLIARPTFHAHGRARAITYSRFPRECTSSRNSFNPDVAPFGKRSFDSFRKLLLTCIVNI